MEWLAFAALLVLVLGILVALAWLGAHGGLGFPWVQFYTRGREAGFRYSEISLLRQAALETKMDDPVSLFTSSRVLDRVIRDLVVGLRLRGEEAGHRFVGRIFDFRRRIELNLPRYRRGIPSTRDLVPGQRMKVTLDGAPYQVTLVENLRRYMAVSYPVGRGQAPGFSWKGQRVNVYFWRKGDAGYYFESRVVEDFLNRQVPLIYLTHSDALIRSQKRGSVRVATDLACHIQNLRTLSEADEEYEPQPGYQCRLVDLSEDGFALLVGGKAKVGLVLKAQFLLEGQPVVLCGTIRGTTYDQERNRSVLHLEAVPPSDRMRNRILTFVYDLFDQRRAIKGAPKLETETPADQEA